MLTAEENELLTETGPETPMGQYFRRFWQPVALSEELPERDGPPIRVTIMDEELVAFRDSEGRVGLVDRECPHRGADMYFGRNEECGLRCVYHGWKFDVNGKAMDLPNVPPGARTSLYENPEYQKGPFAKMTLDSINAADPTNPTVKPVPYVGIQFAAIPEFAGIATEVSQEFSAVYAGQQTVDEALAKAQALTNDAMEAAGYR